MSAHRRQREHSVSRRGRNPNAPEATASQASALEPEAANLNHEGTGESPRADSWFERHATALSTSLLLLGAILLLLGALFAWARATLFDSGGFADAASDSLQDEAVQDRLATRLTDRIVAEDPERARLRPLIRGASVAIVESSQFETIFRQAAERLHARVFDEDSNDLLLDLTAAVARIIELIERAAPELAARIPPEVESGVITVSESDFRATLIRVSDRVSFLAFALPVLSAVAFGGSVYLARNRAAAAFRLGIALAAVAVVVLLGLALGGVLVEEGVRNPANSDAAGGIWWAFADSLRGTMRLVALLGAVLAVGAWWVGNKGWPWGLAGTEGSAGPAHRPGPLTRIMKRG